jgi:hypothetical protein
MKHVLLWAIVVCTLYPATADAQAWLRDPGKVYVQTSYFYLRAGSFFGPDGNTFPLEDGDYVQHVLAFYAEAGVVDRWLMLTLAGELFRRNVLENRGATTGVGDFRLGAWTAIVEKPVRLSAGFLVGLPTGDPSPNAGPNATPEEEAIARSLPTGDGEIDFNFRLALGYSFGGGKWPFQHYLLAEVGYALRTQGLTDQFVYRGEFGARVDRRGWDRVLVIGRLQGAELLGDAAFDPPTFSGLAEFSVLSPGFEVLVRVWDQINVGFSRSSAFRAKNLPASPLYKFTVSWER